MSRLARRRLATRVYRVLLLLYPRAFRRRFAAEMERTWRDEYRGARERGGWHLASLWTRTALGVLVCSLDERRRWLLARRSVSQPILYRTTRREPIMNLVNDLRITFRNLLHRPAFALAAVVTLALGIGANTAVFSVAHGILWRPLALDRPQELVQIWPERAFSTRELIFLRTNAKRLTGVASLAGWSVALTDVDQPTQLRANRTSADVFDLLGVAPFFGRPFTAADTEVGADPVVVLSHSFWTRQLGGDRSWVGRSLTVDGQGHEVVGVMPYGFEVFEPQLDVWIPLTEDPQRWYYTSNVSQLVGRLASGVSLAEAQAEFLQLLDQMRRELGYPGDFGDGASLVPLKEGLVGRYRTTFLVLLGAVGFLLLIAASNLSNLLLAKALDRRREMATRAALGASRGRLQQLLLVESGVLSLAGGGAGLALAFGGVSLLRSMVPASTPRMDGVGVDTTVLLACLGLVLGCALLSALAPAAAMWRIDLGREVSGARTATGSDARAHVVRQGLVVLQVALAVVLVLGSGLMIQTIYRLASADPGFAYRDVLTLRLSPVGSRYDSPPEYRQAYVDLAERLEVLAGVQSVGGVQHLPMSGIGWETPVAIEGQTIPEDQAKPQASWRIVTGRYFESLGIRLLQGRLFTAADGADSEPVAVVNRRFADRFWPDSSPLGRRFQHGRGSTEWVTVVGVVDDVQHFGLTYEPAPEIYRPHNQSTMRTLMLAIKTDGDPVALARTVQDEIWSFDPNLPIAQVAPLSRLVARTYGNARLVMVLLTVFAVVALVLGAIGVYGVTAFTVSRRTGELGLRMALGASHWRVRGEVLRVGVAHAVLGVTLGVLGAVLMMRLLSGIVYGVSVRDPMTFTVVPALILLVATVACYLPARRATSIDPASSLREG